MNINRIQTPCYVLETDKLYHNLKSFKEALNNRFENNVLSYSVKTNSTPVLLDYINKEGYFAEVVSYHEYKLALSCGFPTNRIVYNGPLKNKETFLHAIQNGAFVNIDSKRELDWLRDLPSEGHYSVGLRINLDLQEISPDDCKDKEDFSRFGFSSENNEFLEALNHIRNLGNVNVIGLHLHRTSKTRSIDVYRTNLSRLY